MPRRRSDVEAQTATAMGWSARFGPNILVRALLIAAVLALFLGPFLTTLSGALDARVTARSISLWPSDPTIEHFITAAEYGIYEYLGRSLVIVGGGLALQITTSVLIAYAISLLHIPGKRFVMALMLATIMVPEELIAVPLGLVLRDVPIFGGSLIGSMWGVILPVAVWGFSVLLLSEFMAEIPKELVEAAKLDGVGPLRMLWAIVLPLSTPALGVVTIFGFNMIWDQYLLPLIAAKDTSDYTLTVALQGLAGQAEASIGTVLAGSFLALLPSLVIYILLQRSMVRGITSGALK
ncbi:carbohydrate ABC transporter permease [Agromyces sp. ISL-38]|uniref:carbohydrate ABC transporter permease n=1 Tax=Agromyces sp. ISL-38 TaxID=2819107 RepID=UPI001BEC5D80|nr:carbohydrate ABC transporter permease [Agromyces sp. ISL-38]MBT2497926.1 carbohydrate ABC transporter permease [Agromyces sp. ISL-38]